MVLTAAEQGERSISLRRTRIPGAAVILLLVILAAAGYFIGRHFEEPEEPRATMTEGFGRYEEKIYNSETYYKKTGITTLLLMGIDRDTSGEVSTYRGGGQSDFLMLLVIDHDAKTVRQLQIERDTIARIHVLTVLGMDAGYRDLQICLSHGYGGNQTECAENTIEAVSHYLDNLNIDLYMAVDYDAVPTINDMLGGVTVTLKEDFTSVDPTMKQGEILTLRGKQAEHFVRSRLTIGDGTNASRQLRQREWLDGAVELLKKKIQEDSGFFGNMLDALGNRLVTNAGQGRLINEFNSAFGYDRGPVEQIPGTYGVSNTGYIEYYTQADDVTKWVLSALYRPAAETENQ